MSGISKLHLNSSYFHNHNINSFSNTNVLYYTDLKLSLSYPLDKVSMNICEKISSLLPCRLKRSFANLQDCLHNHLCSRNNSYRHDYDCGGVYDDDDEYELTPQGHIPKEFIIR